MKLYKCVIFDCDGVLVDSEPLSNQVLADMTNELGGKIDLEYALTHFKGGSMQSCYDKIAKLVPQPLPNNFKEMYRERSFELFKKALKPIDGVPQLLEELNLPFGVASSGTKEKIIHNLALTGLSPYFETNIFSCYEIQKWKPDPDVFLWAAKTMGYHPEECVVIEDSLTGVTAARAGGFDVFGFVAHDYNNELPAVATHTFQHMQELREYLVN
ncbi:HAD family phosphatase [Mangrovimonas sp. YM274]|uniref:HAD family hydrolase n=1 Tax=Mangrovimonas sp. YM274 TaxID=3070660 RepID=UPI0027DDC514|nr:HAD family hydrolase [Mangrovimonas sp. YM274]WMI69661.1 HAD family hydrolase [Mangrovimonas sp. YM274]